MTDSPNITALSYIGVQVFENTHFKWFTHITSKTTQLHTRQFALLSPKFFLLCLHSTAKTSGAQVVEVTHEDYLEFRNMTEGVGRIRNALHKYEGE